MTVYAAPTQEIDFVLKNLIDIEKITGYDAFEHVEADDIPALLEEAGRFFAEVVATTNVEGDQHGSVLGQDGKVKLPPSFKGAYEKLNEAGWASISFDPEFGGGGFPEVMGIAIREMLTSANMAFSLCPLLTEGAIHLLESHADEQLRDTWVPKMVTGEWTGTMNLTEPHAGTDVGALSTKAVRKDDGTYAITGQKIFITWGEHDLTDNIVHLVLARTPDAPKGTKGISVFVVPKFLLNEDGSIGERNTVECVSLEHKLGIHASPTAVLSFEDATGYLIGEEQTGMRSMFTMMNSARLAVGLQGLAVAERAYQQAVDYSFERLQSGRPDRERGTSAPIVEHPNVRRMLLTMRSYIDAMRGLCYLNSAALDHAHHNPNAEEAAKSRELAELLTPLSKSWCTDLGNELTSLNVQIHGGMGFIEETGAAQHYRDIRIAAIYEGTNGIQALDLIGRKLAMRDGAVLFELLDQIDATASELATTNTDFATASENLTAATKAIREVTMWLATNRGDDAMAGANAYLRLLATTVGGWQMARSALAATAGHTADAQGEQQEFLNQKLVSARFFLEQLLPPQVGNLTQITGGAELLYAYLPQPSAAV